MINIICACNLNNAIGENNSLLYTIKNDLKRFKDLTVNNFVLFGRKTYESLPKKPLPNRTNIVLSRSGKDYSNEVIVESDVEKILNHYLYTGSQQKDLYIAGGQEIYELFLPYADNVYLTYIEDYTEGDTYFPLDIVESEFEITYREKNYDEDSGLYYSFINYKRKENVDG